MRLLHTFFIFGFVIFSIVFSLFKGSTHIAFSEIFSANNLDAKIFLDLRLPRTLTAFVCGGLLALAGSLMQLLLKNPLADPYILGISGGAALVTLLMIFFGISEYGLLGGAWLGSLLAIMLVLTLSHKHRWQTSSLLLSGLAIAYGFSACISFILIISPDASLHTMLFWLSGDLNDAQFPWLGLIILSIGFIACMLLAPGLNILSRGEQQAKALGLPSKKYKLALYFLSSLLTATAVTLAGCVGFIGLIIPHLTRKLVGYDHRIVLPMAMVLGGSLLAVADTLARTLFAPQQLPVGILMALIGVPIFIALLTYREA